ncbi:MAG: type II secretion system protein [Candidatus Riflebacteria bacterium]|nr:type II secretion system protein [Candidatus Riflebacteria bacterium]
MISLFKKQKGFTMMELVVAVAILALFFGGIFTVYIGGNRIFQGGTWKLRKQKEAEAFFNALRERLEQASYPVIIARVQESVGGTMVTRTKAIDYEAKLRTASGTFATTVASTDGNLQPVTSYGGSAAAPRMVLAFPLCKPKLNPDPNVSGGMILYNSLSINPSQTDSRLMMLTFRSSTNASTVLGGAPATSLIPDLASLSSLSGSPLDFDLGADNRLLTLDDVSKIIIEPPSSAGTPVAAPSPGTMANPEQEPVLNMTIEFRKPKGYRTTFTMNLGIRLEQSDMLALEFL